MGIDEDEATARLRLWQDVSLSDDVDLDAVAARYPDDDEVLTLVDLARENRRLVVILAAARHRAARRQEASLRLAHRRRA